MGEGRGEGSLSSPLPFSITSSFILILIFSCSSPGLPGEVSAIRRRRGSSLILPQCPIPSGQSLPPLPSPMRKQTIILTAWLAMPFLCITLIMTWIFVTLDKDRLMNEPPVGAGAGDTGNANALGQWLAGRDPDQISKANDARREHTAINPFNWPGGTQLTFTHTPPQGRNPATLEARIVLTSQEKKTILIRHPKPLSSDPTNTTWTITLDKIGPNLTTAQIAVGYRTDDSESSTWPLSPIDLAPVYPNDTLASDPITIELRINVVAP